MRKPRFPDAGRLTSAMPAHGLVAGEMGTIVEEFDPPDEAYLVEFSNDYGDTMATVTLKPDQFEVVYPLGRVPEQVGA